MTTQPLLSFFYVLTDLALVGGYGYLAVRVVRLPCIRLLLTRIGGFGFFALGGVTRLDGAYHTLTDGSLWFDTNQLSWFVLGIHSPQVICVWMFIIGLQIEASSREIDQATLPPPGIEDEGLSILD